ncbi:MAG: hypothetical protein ISR58_06865 [Anaerolineales bacterium]|nr:hypothetical protein [Anaerolineales bacterium]
MKHTNFKLTIMLLAGFILVGCSQRTEPTSQSSADESSLATEASPSTVVSPSSVPQATESTQTTSQAFEVTYFTPAQGEGPYFPLEIPKDHDNDLTNIEGVEGFPNGEVIEFSGIVYDANGTPIPEVLIEIWQTDSNGVYLHPGDPGTCQRDPNFQFYGEVVTNENGGYSFRTILPGRYEPRPRHIHVKIKYQSEVLLTTQFYFEGDAELEDEAMFTQVGGEGQHLIISLEEGSDADGNLIWIGQRNIVLDISLTE